MRLEDLQGRRIGRYEIVGLLGRGGMAAVYRAHDTTLRRDVALKVLYPQYGGDRTLIERFEREAVLAAGLDHPNIVPIYDVGEANGLVYIAMKLLGGLSLAEVLRSRGTLSLDEVLPILDQIAAALDYAHARNIVHRDIKAGNIILEEGMGRANPDLRAILTDFGIAKSLDPQTSGLTGTGMLIGTPDYMAPEQIRSGQTVDYRADIYALGVLVFRCLTGQLPFEGGTEQVLLGHLYGTVSDPSMLEPSLPPAVDPVVRTALARDPADRYQSAGTFARALHAAAGAQPIPAAARAVAPSAADSLAWRRSAPDEATRKGDAAPPRRPGPHDQPTRRGGGAPPRGPAPPVAAAPEGRGGAGPIVLAIVLVLLVGGGLLAFVRWGGAGVTLGGAPTSVPAPPPTTALPAESPALPTEPPAPTAEPTAAPTDPAAAPTTPAAPTDAPAPTLAPPPATATPRPTATPAPTATSSPPTETPSPTNTPSPTPCAVPLVGGFGKLWNDDASVQKRIGCPIAAEQGGPGTIAEQPFERGSMFYYDERSVDFPIYVLIGINEGQWRRFGRSQLEKTPTPTPNPEPLCRAPLVGGFGLVWGSSDEIRAALGCPTGPEDGLLEGAYQPFVNGTMLFSQKGLGRGKTIYVLYANGEFERYDDTNP
jgi:serine/threonine-protein kinase